MVVSFTMILVDPRIPSTVSEPFVIDERAIQLGIGRIAPSVRVASATETSNNSWPALKLVSVSPS